MNRLVEIKLIVEVADDADLDRLTDQLITAVCPSHGPPYVGHERCPRGWMVMACDLDEDEASQWEPELNR